MEPTRLSKHLAAAAERFTHSHKIQTTLENYRQFLKGETADIFDTLSEDVVWVHPGNPDLIPFAGTFYGKAGVAKFFETVGNTLRVASMQPFNIVEEENRVIHDLTVEASVLQTGKSYNTDFSLTWTFNEAGKIVRWEISDDMTEMEEAFRGGSVADN